MGTFAGRVKLILVFVVTAVMLAFAFNFTSEAHLEHPEFDYASGYLWEDGYIYGGYIDETVSDLTSASLPQGVVRVRTEDGKNAVSFTKLRTGLLVQLFKYNTVMDQSVLVVRGDVNGDGIVSSVDYLKVKDHFNGNPLSGAYFEAADTDGGKILNSADYLRLKGYFNGSYDLFPEKSGDTPSPTPAKRYEGPYSEVNGAYGGVDDLGREQLYDSQAGEEKDKDVGIFYFLWQGKHGNTNDIFDNSKIVAANPDAVLSDENWTAAGGGKVGQQHFWGEPLFGYYIAGDEWVMRKHVQMLTMAGVDYLVFDTTNGFTYDEEALVLFAILDEYYSQGWDVPKFAYMTHTSSAATMTSIYENIYLAHPEYSHLWYNVAGKPLIIGDNPSAEVSAFFTVRPSQWPDATKKSAGFPWMEFSRYLTTDSIYNIAPGKTLMNVSVAQHNSTSQFSATAWYGGSDRPRSYRGEYYKNLTKEEAMLYGTNFEMGFDYAMYQDPDNIFITGWNEWVAARQKADSYPLRFVDCADTDCSRDIEPMNGILKDNYFMQASALISDFKGAAPRVNTGGSITIDINGSFSQWDAATAVYTDFSGDTADRDTVGFGNTAYKDQSGRNDIICAKAAMDDENIYFYVRTAETITEPDDDQWMVLYLRSGNDTEGASSWEGFDYVINRGALQGGKMTVEKSSGGWNWSVCGQAAYKLEGSEMMVSVPKSAIGIDAGELVDLQFKWADHCGEGEDGSGDVMTFYTKGDAAPYGRFTYIFSEVEK